MTPLKISVAMCTYNGERYLREQLDSIARQARLPDELVVCDDNSTDRTIEIINAFTSSAPFSVRLYKNNTNIGSTKNFEQAIKFCGGEIIALADQDDVWHPDKLELTEQIFLDSQETGAVFSNGTVVNESLSPMGYTLWETFGFKRKDKSDFNSGKSFDVLLKHNVVTGATMAFRSKLRETILPIPSIWIHDKWAAIIISALNNICYIDKCLVDYRQHGNQQIGGLNKKSLEKIKQSMKVDNYKTQINEYELLLDYFLHQNLANRSYIITRIEEKISHLKMREDIYKCGIVAKFAKVAMELLKGRYHSYSNGYLSAYKDLLL